MIILNLSKIEPSGRLLRGHLGTEGEAGRGQGVACSSLDVKMWSNWRLNLNLAKLSPAPACVLNFFASLDYIYILPKLFEMETQIS